MLSSLSNKATMYIDDYLKYLLNGLLLNKLYYSSLTVILTNWIMYNLQTTTY